MSETGPMTLLFSTRSVESETNLKEHADLSILPNNEGDYDIVYGDRRCPLNDNDWHIWTANRALFVVSCGIVDDSQETDSFPSDFGKIVSQVRNVAGFSMVTPLAIVGINISSSHEWESLRNTLKGFDSIPGICLNFISNCYPKRVNNDWEPRITGTISDLKRAVSLITETTLVLPNNDLFKRPPDNDNEQSLARSLGATVVSDGTYEAQMAEQTAALDYQLSAILSHDKVEDVGAQAEPKADQLIESLKKETQEQLHVPKVGPFAPDPDWMLETDEQSIRSFAEYTSKVATKCADTIVAAEEYRNQVSHLPELLSRSIRDMANKAFADFFDNEALSIKGAEAAGSALCKRLTKAHQKEKKDSPECRDIPEINNDNNPLKSDEVKKSYSELISKRPSVKNILKVWFLISFLFGGAVFWGITWGIETLRSFAFGATTWALVGMVVAVLLVLVLRLALYNPWNLIFFLRKRSIWKSAGLRLLYISIAIGGGVVGFKLANYLNTSNAFQRIFVAFVPALLAMNFVLGTVSLWLIKRCKKWKDEYEKFVREIEKEYNEWSERIKPVIGKLMDKRYKSLLIKVYEIVLSRYEHLLDNTKSLAEEVEAVRNRYRLTWQSFLNEIESDDLAVGLKIRALPDSTARRWQEIIQKIATSGEHPENDLSSSLDLVRGIVSDKIIEDKPDYVKTVRIIENHFTINPSNELFKNRIELGDKNYRIPDRAFALDLRELNKDIWKSMNDHRCVIASPSLLGREELSRAEYTPDSIIELDHQGILGLVYADRWVLLNDWVEGFVESLNLCWRER